MMTSAVKPQSADDLAIRIFHIQETLSDVRDRLDAISYGVSGLAREHGVESAGMGFFSQIQDINKIIDQIRIGDL